MSLLTVTGTIAGVVTLVALRWIQFPPELVVAVSVTFTGLPAVGVALGGSKLQVTPSGSPDGHASVTLPAKDPDALTTRLAVAPLPSARVTLPGEGLPKLKSTTCRITAASCVIWAESLPSP